MLDIDTFLNESPLPSIDCDGIKLGKILGEGGNAIVYRLEINNEKYAAKVYTDDSIHEDFYDNLKYELDIAKKLSDSKYSVRTYKVGYIRGEFHNQILILMELLTSHGDLYDYLQNVAKWTACYKINNQFIPKPKNNYIYFNKDNNIHWCYELSELQKIKIARSIISGVKELHSKGIIHGDIKTNNMVLHYLPKKQIVKLVDFGMSYFSEGNGLIDIYYKCGTMGYRAPEQDQLKMNYSSDIYSTGVTIVELWNGDIWNDEETFNECRKEVLSGLRKIEANNKMFGKLLRDSINMNHKKRISAKTFLKRFNTIFNNDHKYKRYPQN